MPVTATPISRHIGVEITGVAGSDLPNPGAAKEMLEALEQHGVVVYREADISDEDLVAFSRLLGDVVVTTAGEHEYPEISTITLDPQKSRLAAYRQGTFLWHIDGATDLVPQKATLLTARELADEGGDTEFANTYAAYEELSESEKKQFSKLQVVHSFAAAQRRSNPDASPEQQAAWEKVPSRVHPLVWTRRNGRKSLLLGATAGEVVGLPKDEGNALLDRLLEWATQPQFVLRHQWRRGDLVIWDNTGMLHRAIPYSPTSRRLMHRTTLAGDEAVA